MSFGDDISEPADERLIDEGRKRLRTAGLTDAQVNEWIAAARRRGGRIELVPEGLRAVYAVEAPARLVGAEREAFLKAGE